VRAWYELVVARKIPNAEIELVDGTDRLAYVGSLQRAQRNYDVIVVDGLVENNCRLDCVRQAMAALNTGGLIILDNSDRLPKSCLALSEAGFTEMPFNGFAPLNSTPSRTSVFFRDTIGIEKLPHRWTVGGVQKSWE